MRSAAPWKRSRVVLGATPLVAATIHLRLRPPLVTQRIRTVQRFDDISGALECFCLIRETRVLDAVTGALDRYPGRRGTQ